MQKGGARKWLSVLAPGYMGFPLLDPGSVWQLAASQLQMRPDYRAQGLRALSGTWQLPVVLGGRGVWEQGRWPEVAPQAIPTF